MSLTFANVSERDRDRVRREREVDRKERERKVENPSKPQLEVNGPQTGHELTCDLDRIVG